jgi:hypothetical protein
MRPLLAGSLALVALALGAAPVMADWKSWLHGAPPPAVKSAPPKQLAAVSSAAGAASDPQVESFMRLFAAAIMARDGAAIAPRLSERYAIEEMPDDAKAADLMAQAIEQMAGPTQIVVLSVEKDGESRVAKVEMRYDRGKSGVNTFRFDARGNLLASDLFRLRVERGR